MDTDDSPIESQRGTKNQLAKRIPHHNNTSRFQNITRQLNPTPTPNPNNHSSRHNNPNPNLNSHPPSLVAHRSKSPINMFRQSQLNERDTISIILRPYPLILHNQLTTIQGQMVLTTSGLGYVLRIGEQWINLAWLHSIKRIEKTKILVLFYHMSPIIEDRKPGLQPQVLEFTDKQQAEEYYQALVVMHRGWNDAHIQKLYHQTM